MFSHFMANRAERLHLSKESNSKSNSVTSKLHEFTSFNSFCSSLFLLRAEVGRGVAMDMDHPEASAAPRPKVRMLVQCRKYTQAVTNRENWKLAGNLGSLEKSAKCQEFSRKSASVGEVVFLFLRDGKRHL